MGYGGGAAVSTAHNTARTRRIGSAIKTAKGGVEGLKGYAANVATAGQDKGLTRFAAKLKDTSSNARVGKAYRMTEASVREQNKADLAKTLQEKGYSKKQAAQIAEAAVSSAAGWRLTQQQKDIWSAAQQDPDVVEAVKQALQDEGSAVFQRNRQSENFRRGVQSRNMANFQAVGNEDGPVPFEQPLQEQLKASGLPVAERATQQPAVQNDGVNPPVTADAATAPFRQGGLEPTSENNAEELTSSEMRQAMQEAYANDEISEEEYDEYLEAMMEQLGMDGVTEEGQLLQERNEAAQRMQEQAAQQEMTSIQDEIERQWGGVNTTRQADAQGERIATPAEPARNDSANLGGGTDNGTDVLHGSGQRNDRASAGEPAGSVAGRAGQDQKRGGAGADRVRAKLYRQNLKQDLRSGPEVSSRELGVESGTDRASCKVVPESMWDAGMRDADEKAYRETGKHITYVVGPIEMVGKDGKVRNARGVTTDAGILVRIDGKMDGERIGDHEIFHGLMDLWDSQSGRRVILDGLMDELLQRYDPEQLRQMLTKYKEALRGIYTEDSDADPGGDVLEDVDYNVLEELLADAYAGINGHAMGVARMQDTVRQWLRDNYIEQDFFQDNGTEQPTGPPTKERFSYGGEKARTADLDALRLAKEMQAEGVADETIRQQTGWFVGRDGKWRMDQQSTQNKKTSPEQEDDSASDNYYEEAGLAEYRDRNLAEDKELYNFDFLASLPDMKPVILPSVDSVRNSKQKVDRNAVESLGMQNARAVGIERNGKVYVQNTYTGRMLRIDNSTIQHGLEGDLKRLLTNARLGAVIGDVVKNAVPINAMYDEAKNVTGTYVMGAYATDDKGREFVVTVTVEQNDGNISEIGIYDVAHALNGRQKRGMWADTESRGFNHITHTSKISIEDFLYIVKDTFQTALSDDVLMYFDEGRSPHGYYSDRVKYSVDDSTTEDEGERIATPAEPARNDSGDLEPARNDSGEQAQASDTEEQKDSYSTLPTKARDYVKRAERTLLEKIGQVLSVPKAARRDFLAETVRAITNEYLQNGTVSKQAIDGLFEQAYAQGIVADEEFYRQYEHIKKHMRDTAVTLAEQDRSDIADYYDFKRRAGGLLKIRNEGGLPVDTAYQELQYMAPELFPDNITHPADQLVRMLQVAQSIEVTYNSLDRYYGDDAASFKRDARHEFEGAIDKVVGELYNARRYMDEKSAEREKPPVTMEEAEECWKGLKAARRNYEKVMAKNLLTDHDQRIVGDLLYGKATLENLDPKRDNVKGITAVYEAKREYAQLVSLITEYKRQLKGKLRSEADALLETANEWKDKSAGWKYSRETMRRNVLDIVKDPEVADKILRKYFEPVAVAEAAATRFKDQYRQRVEELGLSRKVKKGDTVSEAHAVQLLGEAMDNIALIESARGRLEHRDGKTLTEWEAVVQELWESSPSLDKAKIEKAVQEFRTIYDELFQQMNRERVKNGYEPVNYRKGYFPHFQPGNSDGILAHFGRILGISTEVTALPTTINGLTHTFKPGIQWFGNAQERLGFNTAYDAIEGFDKYIEGVASVIHQTENIQRLRALAGQIRYRTSDEGIRKQVDAVMQDERFTEEEKKAQIDSIYEHARFTLSNFVVELDEYTNLLANKKSRRDREIESDLGRRFYNVMKWLEQRVAANMIAGNLSSALTNVIPLTQAAARMGNINMAVGMWNTLKAYIKDDGMVETSTFLTNRRGSDPLIRTWIDNASDIVGKPMEFIDSFVADSIVRGAYYKNLKLGLTEDEAMRQADLFAASVMADRSKGAMPTIFQSRNPLTKLFTQFQLEVNNQFSEIFKDMPREVRSKGKAALVGKLIQYFLGAWLFNELFEFLFGRRPALDPIGILNETIGDFSGYELPNLLELGVGAITGDISFETEKAGFGGAITNLGENILGELPFSSALGLFGIGEDSRIPVSSAMPDVTKLISASTDSGWSAKKRLKTAADELSKPITYLAMPFGGNQLSKIIKGITATVMGGSYTVDNEGNDILQYPVFHDPWSALRAAFMGKSSLPEAQEWVDSGFDSFSAKATATYQGVLDVGTDDRDAYALVDELRHAKKTGTQTKADVQREILRSSDVSAEAKVVAYCGMVASESELDWLSRLADMDPDAQSVFDVAVGLKEADALKGTEARQARAEAIADTALTEEQKIVVVESFLGNEWQTDTGKPTQYAKFRNALETGLTVDDYMELYAQGAEMDSYFEYTDAGLSAGEAADMVKAVSGLAPVEGKDSVSSVQKWRAAVDSQTNAEDQLAALSAEMTDSQYRKARVANEYGVDPKMYVRMQELLPKYDEDGNGSYKQAEVKTAIDAMSGQLGLSNEQKAVAWQLITGAKSAKNNPYSAAIGEQIIDLLDKLKEEESDDMLSFSDEVMRQLMANM